jgi:glycosyltransferase involved in cell wall biosynthesis
VPVIASNRGALPEVLGEAGVVCRDARAFSWDRAAQAVHAAYEDAVARRDARLASAARTEQVTAG